MGQLTRLSLPQHPVVHGKDVGPVVQRRLLVVDVSIRDGIAMVYVGIRRQGIITRLFSKRVDQGRDRLGRSVMVTRAEPTVLHPPRPRSLCVR